MLGAHVSDLAESGRRARRPGAWRAAPRPTTSCSSGTRACPPCRPRRSSTIRRRSTTSCRRRSPPCSALAARASGPTEGFEGYLVSSVRHEAYRANRRRQPAATARRPGPTSLPTTRSPAVRTRPSCAPPSTRCLPSPATCCGGPRSRDGRTPTSPASSARRRQAIAARAARARDALGGAYLAGHLDLALDAAAGRRRSARRCSGSSSTSCVVTPAGAGGGAWRVTSPNAPGAGPGP